MRAKTCPISPDEERYCEERTKEARDKDVADASARAGVAKQDARRAQDKVKEAIRSAEIAEQESAAAKAKVCTATFSC